MNDNYKPHPEHLFSFGLWNIGHLGHDAHGPPTRAARLPAQLVALLAEEGAWGVNLQDDDLVPPHVALRDRDKIVRWFRAALDTHGVRVPMVSANLSADPVFRDGAFTSHDPDVRAYALQKTMFAIDLAVELGAETFLFSGGREGAESDCGKDHGEASRRYRECLNFLSCYVQEQGYRLRFALEARPHEPRGHLALPTTAAALAFLYTLEYPDMVGLSPNLAHEARLGLHPTHSVAQAWEAGKLFHLSLSDQHRGNPQLAMGFGATDLHAAFFLVRFLETVGYTGPRHFDVQPSRVLDEMGIRALVRGCMRNYLILREKAYRFSVDPEVVEVMEELSSSRSPWAGLESSWSPQQAHRLLQTRFDLARIAQRPLPYARLDQLLTEILLGVR